MKLSAVALVSLTGLASAQPKTAARPAPPKPVCAPAYAQARMVLVGSEPVACFREEEGKPEVCLTASASGASRSVPAPPAAPKQALAAELRDEGGTLSACAGAKCIKLGKKLVAAIAEQKAEGSEDNGFADPAPRVSPDLKLLTVGGKAWSVKGDKLLKLSAPVEYKKNREAKPYLGGVEIAGNLVLAHWANCAGPCTYSVVIDTAGKNRSRRFPAGTVLPLDDKRVVVMPEESDSQMTVLDAASVKILATLQLGHGVLEGLGAVRIDPNTIGAVWTEGTAWTIASIALVPGTPPALTTRELAACPQ